MERSQIQLLIREAYEAQKNAYAPYSRFRVGAALLAADGEIFRGCNIENAAFTPTSCAERTAIFKAVSENVREFRAIAIVGGKEDCREEEKEFCPPCGVCRQVMREFCDPERFRIILAVSEENYREYLLKDLLPLSFAPSDLE